MGSCHWSHSQILEDYSPQLDYLRCKQESDEEEI